MPNDRNPYQHTCLGSGRCSSSQWAIQELMCAGGTGPCHQPGSSFMKEQLERDGEDSRKKCESMWTTLPNTRLRAAAPQTCTVKPPFDDTRTLSAPPPRLYSLFALRVWSCEPAYVENWDLAGNPGALTGKPGGPLRGSWYLLIQIPQEWLPAAEDATHWSSSPTGDHTRATGWPKETKTILGV